ncbi:MAG: cadherin-like domain-containing protein, partial [Rhodospirillales bacterium]
MADQATPATNPSDEDVLRPQETRLDEQDRDAATPAAPEDAENFLANVHLGTQEGASDAAVQDGGTADEHPPVSPGQPQAGDADTADAAPAAGPDATALAPVADDGTAPGPEHVVALQGGGGGAPASGIAAAGSAAPPPPASADEPDAPPPLPSIDGRPAPDAATETAPAVATAAASEPPGGDQGQAPAPEDPVAETPTQPLPAPDAGSLPPTAAAAPDAAEAPGEAPLAGAVTPSANGNAPVASDDGVATTENRTLIIDGAQLLANDVDLDGDALTIVGFDQPAHGTLASDGNGRLVYVPEADYIGGDSFSYTVADSHGATATATVTVTVAADNVAPVAVGDLAAVNEDSALVISAASLLGNDTDADGDALVITGFGQPAHGTLVDNGDGTFTYTPASNYAGADAFTYTVADGNGGTATGTVTLAVNPVNDAPVAVTDVVAATMSNAVVISAASLLGNDTDAEGDTLSVTSVGNPAHGTLVNNGDGTYTYRSNWNYTGPDSFTYTVSDGHGGTTKGTVTVNVGDTSYATWVGTAGNDTVTTLDNAPGSYTGLAGNDTFHSGAADATFLYDGANNGFDNFATNGAGHSVAKAGSSGTVIGVAGFNNGVDAFEGAGDTIVRDDGYSRTLNFANTALTGIAEIDAAGGNDTITTSNVSAGSYRGGSGNDTFNSGSQDATFLYSGTNNGNDSFATNGAGHSVAKAETAGTVIGVAGFNNGVDAIEGTGDTIIRDDGYSRTLNFANTTLTGIAEIDAGGGDDTITTSN